jgi:hypothetical protein
MAGASRFPAFHPPFKLRYGWTRSGDQPSRYQCFRRQAGMAPAIVAARIPLQFSRVVKSASRKGSRKRPAYPRAIWSRGGSFPIARCSPCTQSLFKKYVALACQAARRLATGATRAAPVVQPPMQTFTIDGQAFPMKPSATFDKIGGKWRLGSSAPALRKTRDYKVRLTTLSWMRFFACGRPVPP